MKERFFLFIVLLPVAFSSPAQVLQDRITGKYFFDIKTGELRGSPYLYDDWRPSLITYENGLQLKNVKLKFDQYNNRLLFQRNDSAFEFIEPVWEFIIYNPGGDSVIFRNGYLGGEGKINSKTYLEVTSEGTLTLLRFQSKTKSETRGFGSATMVTEYTFFPSVFCTVQNKKLVKIKKNDEEALRDLMKKDWEAVADYIRQHKLSLKKDADLIAVFNYYNSL